MERDAVNKALMSLLRQDTRSKNSAVKFIFIIFLFVIMLLVSRHYNYHVLLTGIYYCC